MSVVSLMLGAYLLLGVIFAILGPVRTSLSAERGGGQSAKRTLLSQAYSVLWRGIIGIFLWPIFAADVIDDLKRTRRAQAVIAAVERSPKRTITFKEFVALQREVGHPRAGCVLRAMHEAGYLVSLASDENGREVPVTLSVAATVHQPFVIERDGPGADDWSFSTSPESWRKKMGLSGRALLKDGAVVAVAIKMMN